MLFVSLYDCEVSDLEICEVLVMLYVVLFLAFVGS